MEPSFHFGAHPASYLIGTVGSFHMGKQYDDKHTYN